MGYREIRWAAACMSCQIKENILPKRRCVYFKESSKVIWSTSEQRLSVYDVLLSTQSCSAGAKSPFSQLCLSLNSAFGLRLSPCVPVGVKVCVLGCVCVCVCVFYTVTNSVVKLKQLLFHVAAFFCCWLKLSADERKAIWLFRTCGGVSCAIKVSRLLRPLT